MYGPIQFSVIGFDNDDIIDGLLYQLDLLRTAGTIRLVDFLFVAKDAYGNIYAREVSDLTQDEKEQFGAVVGGLIGLGAGGAEGAALGAALGEMAVAENDFGLLGSDIHEIIQDIPEGTSACVVLFEHAWARKIKEYAYDNGGVLLAQGLIHPAALVEIGEELADAIEAEIELEEELEKEAATKKGTSTEDLKKQKTSPKKGRPKKK
jgi:uncharacterized membrane protein